MKRQFLAALLCVVFVAASSLPSGAAADSWFEIKSANFTVWANANDGATRTLVWQLEQIRNVARTLWPWFKVDLTKPLVIIADDDEGDALATLPVNKLRDGLEVAAVNAPGFVEHRPKDLADDDRSVFTRIDGDLAPRRASGARYQHRSAILRA